MFKVTSYKRILGLLVLLGLLGFTVTSYAQSIPQKSDAEQISTLMTALSTHSKTPSEVLDPNLDSSDRNKDLNSFSASNYELSLTPTEAPQITGNKASVPVRIHFDDKNGNTLDANTTAHFIKSNGVWYFANFDFLSWPAILIIILILGVLIGVAYAATGLTLMYKLKKKGKLDFRNLIKCAIPFFWPSLFRQLHQ